LNYYYLRSLAAYNQGEFKMKNKNMAALLVLLIGLTGCGTSNSDRAVSGGAIGAGVGAVGASVIGGTH
jgi:hypothetical protein